MLRTEAI